MNINIKIKGFVNQVIIYDSFNNIVYDKKYCNDIKTCLNKGVYKIKIISINKILFSSFLVNKNNTFYFILDQDKIILLTDYNYDGLPIEKGLLLFS